MTTQKIDSNAFFTTLSTNFAAAREEIKLATDQDVTFHIFSSHYNQKITININNSKYNNEKIEVEGFSLSDLVAEFIRRARFTTSQANLQIGPPIIDAEGE